MASTDASFARADRLRTATVSVGVTSETIVSPSSKGGLIIKNGHASYVVWVRDPEEGEPSNGVGYPIAAGAELALGDYRGSLLAVSPSGTASVYVAWTAHSRVG